METKKILQNFVTQFPQYFTNGFYVIGESYAGHYVPNIMNYIYKQDKSGSGKFINLKGFGIGNGLTDPYIQFQYYADMAYSSHTAQNSPLNYIPISQTLYNMIVQLKNVILVVLMIVILLIMFVFYLKLNLLLQRVKYIYIL